MEWWWCQGEKDGYVPRNLLGLYPRVTPMFNLVDPNSGNPQSSTNSQESSNQTTSHTNTELKNISEEDEDVAMSS